VLAQVVQGRLNKQIAADLGIRERTVKLHRTAITTKLGVQSVAELTRLTDQAGIFSTSGPTFPSSRRQGHRMTSSPGISSAPRRWWPMACRG
jgi:hypothetical protein